MRLLNPLISCSVLLMLSLNAHATKGKYFIHGGGSVKEIMYDHWVELAGGANSKICIFGTNSSDPAGAIAFYEEKFGSRGAITEAIDIRASNSAWNTTPIEDDDYSFSEVRTTEQRLSESADIVAKVESCDAFWFGGGNQSRTLVSLQNEDGTDTPVAVAIKQRLEQGVAIGGTSAGAAIQGSPVIVSGTSADSLSLPLGEDQAIVRNGLQFMPPGFMTDQHFLARGRIGRLAAAMRDNGGFWGIGVDEDTAISVDLTSGFMNVLGDNQVILMNANEADEALSFDVHLLGHNDQFDILNKQVNAFSDLTDITDRPYYYPRVVQTNDVFGDYEVPTLMTKLMDTQELYLATGLHIASVAEESWAAFGIQLLVERDENSKAWYCLSSCRRDNSERSVNNSRYTLSNLKLTFRPAAMIVAGIEGNIENKKVKRKTRKAIRSLSRKLLK